MHIFSHVCVFINYGNKTRIRLLKQNGRFTHIWDSDRLLMFNIRFEICSVAALIVLLIKKRRSYLFWNAHVVLFYVRKIPFQVVSNILQFCLLLVSGRGFCVFLGLVQWNAFNISLYFGCFERYRKWNYFWIEYFNGIRAFFQLITAIIYRKNAFFCVVDVISIKVIFQLWGLEFQW